jgi:hypothetical protein
MSDPDWEILQKHFEEKRVPIGTAIRMILIEHLKKEGQLK